MNFDEPAKVADVACLRAEMAVELDGLRKEIGWLREAVSVLINRALPSQMEIKRSDQSPFTPEFVRRMRVRE